METDVVIVGYGPAGAAAAIAAYDEGAEVLVLDSTAHGGGNALYSGGFLFDIPGDACLPHLDALCFGRTSREILETYADGLHTMRSWLTEIGAVVERFDPPTTRLPATFPSWPWLPGGRSIEYLKVVGGERRSGVQLWACLHAAVGDRRVPVRYDTAVADLVVEDGAVRGVVTCDGETILARGGVVLACGGFEGDPSLVESFLPLASKAPVGHSGNTGLGLRMSQRVGASLWHMYGFFGWFAFVTPEFASPFAIDFFGASHVFVDADGRRFSDETGYEVHDRLRALSTYLPRNANRPRLPSWAIFDESARLAGPLNGLLGTPNEYSWSKDNAAEIERGWILKASAPADLGELIGVDPLVLSATLSQYNTAAGLGRDEQFGRSRDTLVQLDTSRLYAIQTWPSLAGTTGGPRYDTAAHVLRPDGSAVPGLFVAGAVSMIWGYQIDHGGGLTNALVFGRIAGRSASRYRHGHAQSSANLNWNAVRHRGLLPRAPTPATVMDQAPKEDSYRQYDFE